MGGKGRIRREKNYLAAHGGPARLPPPPDPSQVDALPSKLRKIILFTSSGHGSDMVSKNNQDEKRNAGRDVAADKKHRPGNETKPEVIHVKDGDDDEYLTMPQHSDSGDEIVQNDKNEKRKKKRKRKEVKDLRFETLDNLGAHSKRKERKKKYLEEKKKKRKKAKTEENLDFPGRENIKFGEVVEAPPKLVAVPKGSKIDASKERLRLQAIDAYRNRKGWTSRPGLLLPPVTTSATFS